MVARLLIIAGLGIAGLGVIFPLFGHMPGDMEFGRAHVRFWIPLGSCILASVYFSVVLIAGWWFMFL